MTRAYLLPTDQVSRVLEAGGPLVELGFTAETLKDMIFAVVEVDGRIVAYWVVWKAVHVEPLWVTPAHRKQPAVIRGIVEAMQDAVALTGETTAFCVIERENAEVVAQYATRLGFLPAPGSLYYLVPTPAEVPEEAG
jgi:hypothetical protein